jgi:hypothetical protein
MNKESIGGWLAITSLACHAYAYVFWENYKTFNLYYISMYAMFYCLGLALSMVAQSTVMKVASALTMTVSGYCLYIEFAGDPSDWKPWEIWLGCLIIIQGFLTVLIFEKLKK